MGVVVRRYIDILYYSYAIIIIIQLKPVIGAGKCTACASITAGRLQIYLECTYQ